MSTIASVRISQHALPLDPPFPAAWDSRPRTRFPACVVEVTDSEGRVGIGGGEPPYGLEDYLHLFLGQPVENLARHGEVLANVEFHAGRPWALEVALWDLAGKIRGEPLWRMLGGRGNRIRAYASSGTHRSPQVTAAFARDLVVQGFGALKLRFGRADLDADFAVLAAVREAVGDALELMVDCNQGWRMPWDIQAPWSVDEALVVARELARHGVYWMEEPLHRGDYAGMARLRAQAGVRIAGGEMTREVYEFRALLAQGCLDVYQPDVVCSIGLGRLRALAEDIVAAGHVFTPHTWGNGIGVLANLHLTAGSVGAPFIEYPYDPPEWTADRRDFVITEPVQVDSHGWITLSDKPGLGAELNRALLAETEVKAAVYR